MVRQLPYWLHDKLCEYDHDVCHDDEDHHDYADLGNLSYLSLLNEFIQSTLILFYL